MARILRRARAIQDVLDIWDYIEANSGEEHANAQIYQIERSLQVLAEFPGIGRSRGELLPDLRSHSVGRYVIFYFALDDGIRVARILHGSRDIPAILREEIEGNE